MKGVVKFLSVFFIVFIIASLTLGCSEIDDNSSEPRLNESEERVSGKFEVEKNNSDKQEYKPGGGESLEDSSFE